MRLLLCTWCLMCVIFINSYTGNLTSYLAVPALKPIPNSFEELAARKDLNIMIDRSILAESILVLNHWSLWKKTFSDETTFDAAIFWSVKSTRRFSSQKSNYLFKTVQQGVEILFSGKTVYPGVRPFYVTVTLSAKIWFTDELHQSFLDGGKLENFR